MSEDFDVIVVGAGLSGIGAGYFLQRDARWASYAILEARDRLGGTWDLFRYPGIRSDSDMHTLGFSFRPWTEAQAIADGPSILRYLEDTAREYGIDRHIRYRQKVVEARWSSEEARWTLTIEQGESGERVTMHCRFLSLCAGYYDYAGGHTPEFAGAGEFGGRIVHPQFWPEDLDVAGKRVVVIGSGATAVTLVPELAALGAEVTMLQRSPTYIVARPRSDRVANGLRRVLPERAAYGLTRWKNVLLGQFFFRQMRKHPDKAATRLIGWVRDHLGERFEPEHFTPHYKPWDQRLCLVPDGDLFQAIRSGKASVVTGVIERFTPTAIRLSNGEELPADIVVTATGLSVKLLGGVNIVIDGERFDPAKSLLYKGTMFSDVPNLAMAFGYTNASWTLKADLSNAYVARLLNEMRCRGMRQVMPRITDPDVVPEPFLEFTSGYIQRVADQLPRQGSKAPWRLKQSYLHDLLTLRYGRLDDSLEFSNPEPERVAP